MGAERIVDSENEHRLQEAAKHEAQSEQETAITPGMAGALLSGQMAGAQRQALVQNVAQNYGNRQVQRMLGSLKRSASAGLEGGPLEQDLATKIQSERSNGQPLDSSVRRELEQSLGHDMSPVRVHTGGTAAELNEQLGAKAFTTGRDIFFGEGHSPSDRELITHEATHTIQQGMSEEPPALVGAANTAHEQAAEHNASQAGSAVGGGVQRQEMPPDEEDQVQASRDPNALQREGEGEELEEDEEKKAIGMSRDPDALQRDELDDEQ